MRSCSNVQGRAGGGNPVNQNVAFNVVRIPKHVAVRTRLSAALSLVTGQASRPGRLCKLRPHASTEVNAKREKGLDSEDQDDYAKDDEEFIPPPLPASALELLSELLTGIAAANMANPTTSGAGPSNADGAFTGAYRPLRFCVNCCRPLSSSSAVCAGCGHDPARDSEVLGDANAWVEAYAAQLQRQQGQDEQARLQQQQQLPPQQQHQQAGAAATAAASFGAAPAPGPPARPADVLLAADVRTLLHRSSLPPYPGRPERLQAIMSRLHSTGLMDRCRLLACRPATDPELLTVHRPELVAAVRGMGTTHSAEGQAQPCGSAGGSSAHGPCSCGGSAVSPEVGLGPASASSGVKAASPRAATTSAAPVPVPVPAATPGPHICADTLFNAHTCTAALLAAGAAADVGVALASGSARRALAVMRPPGAQAGLDVARGGCYLNNAAVAAAAALASGVQRVLIVDWDVHHGRGTQEIFADDPRVMVVSMHRYGSEIYPGTGAVEEVGEGEAEGTNLNIAFAGSNLVDGDLLSAALHVVLPVAYQFRPQVVLVVAGFGALRGDPIGGCSCSPAVFAHLTHLLAGVAPKGLGLLLEGGYNLAATAEAVEGCLRVLLGEAPPALPGHWGSTSQGWVAIMNAMQIHSHYWTTLHPLSFHGWTSAIANQQRQLQQQQEAEAEERERHALELALQQQHEEELAQQMQQQQLQQEHGQYFGASYSAASAYGAAGAGGWAAGGLRDDDRDADDGMDDGADGDGLSPEDLATVAAALQRTREGWAAENAGGQGTAAEGADDDLVAAELTDPRDIEPAELLDLFLGTGSSGEEDTGAESGSSSSAVAARGMAEVPAGEEGESDGDVDEGGKWSEWASGKSRK